jgi:hypothetical protein
MTMNRHKATVERLKVLGQHIMSLLVDGGPVVVVLRSNAYTHYNCNYRWTKIHYG